MPCSLGNDDKGPSAQGESLRTTVADNMERGRSVEDLNDLIALRVPLPYSAAGELGDENSTIPVRREARQGVVFLPLRCRRLRRPPSTQAQLGKFGIQIGDCQHHPSPSLSREHLDLLRKS